jgi:ATP-dependent Clp protease adapter protein ClpS
MPQTPPRFVPTLTQVVPPPTKSMTSTQAPSLGAPARATPVQVELMALQLRQKLLTQARQHIDLQLQKRIRETISQLALEHAHKLFEELHPQLEAIVVAVVDDAMRQAVAKVSTQALE